MTCIREVTCYGEDRSHWVADIMGHEKASFTFARYGHALKKDTHEAVVKLEGILFGTG